MRKPLRDYQAFDIELIFERWKECQSTLYVAATGLGKTRVMTEVASRMLPGRTILLAHRNELISQAAAAFVELGMGVEIEKAEQVAGASLLGKSSVVIASVQTMLSGRDNWSRMLRFNPNDFALLLYDESHHAVSAGNKKIVDYFVNGNPNLKVLGVTATPDRADEVALGKIFQTVAADRDILWANQNGWLVPVAQQMIEVRGLDFSEIRTTCGDLNSADLAAVMEAEESVQGIVQPTLETLYDLKPGELGRLQISEWHDKLSNLKPIHRAIVFTVSVRQAQMLSDIFNRVAPGKSSWICGKTSNQDRLDTLTDFKEGGKLSILVNVGVTTEGYDNPAVDLIVMARPTKSRSLYCQCIGRGTRPVPGLVDQHPNAKERNDAILSSAKPKVIVMDFCGNAGRHKLMNCADVLGGNFNEEVQARAIKKARETRQPMLMNEALLEAEEEMRKEREARRLSEEARKARIVARVDYTSRTISPFDVLALEPAIERGWDQERELSEKQRAVLQNNGIDPKSMPYPQAKKMIDTLFLRRNKNLCTFKQAKLLRKNGIDPVKVTFEKARMLIDRLAANHWRPLSQDSISAVLSSTVPSRKSQPESEVEAEPSPELTNPKHEYLPF